MERFKKYFLLAVGLGLLGLVLAVLGTKPAHALIATLVQDVDNPARHPFYAQCFANFTGGNTAGCTVPVPATQRLVVQYISARGIQNLGTKLIALDTSYASGGAGANSFTPFTDAGPFGDSAEDFVLSAPVTLYVDPNSIFFLEVDASTATAGSFVAVSVSGYTITP
jgi:hypothetical protein